MSFKLYNPSSFAEQLTPEHKIWVQTVHRALTDLLNGVSVLQTQVLKTPLEEVKKSELPNK